MEETMFSREAAQCPFCGCEKHRVRLVVNDMPEGDIPGDMRQSLEVVCSGCGKDLFQTLAFRDGKISAHGVAVCETCSNRLRQEHNGWRKQDVPTTTFPLGASKCPRCAGTLQTVWWRDWDYTV